MRPRNSKEIKMQICGLNKTTLLDYPEHVAATVFTGGCNFCCPFCHNGDLVLNPHKVPLISEEELFAFLEKRKGILDGVCITGGEPTLQRDLPKLIDRIKEMGYLVKLDTNGSAPEVLEMLFKDRMLDYVAMDIKASKENYARACGLASMDIGRIEASAQLLMGNETSYEFRTTVVRGLHEKEDFEKIGQWLKGNKAYFLQAYRDSENVIQGGFTQHTKEEMDIFAVTLRNYMERVEIRGVN